MACGNNKISRDYLSSQPDPGRPADKLFRSRASDGLRDVDYRSRFGGQDYEGTHFYFGGDPAAPERHRDGHGHGYVDSRGEVTIYRDEYDWKGGEAARAAATKKYKPATRPRR